MLHRTESRLAMCCCRRGRAALQTSLCACRGALHCILAWSDRCSEAPPYAVLLLRKGHLGDVTMSCVFGNDHHAEMPAISGTAICAEWQAFD